MADSYSQALLQALSGQRSSYEKQNALLAGGNAVATANLYDAEADPLENLAMAALQGFGGGAMAGFGQQQVDSNYADFSNRLAQALASPNPVGAASADSELAQFAPIIQGQARERQINLDDTETLRKNEFAREIQKALGDATLRDPRVVKQLANKVLPKKPQTQAQGTVSPVQEREQDPYGLGPSLEEKYQTMLMQEQEMGTPPGTAADSVLTRLKPNLIQQKQAQDKVAKVRETAELLRGLGEDATAGALTSGPTGTIWAGASEMLAKHMPGKEYADQAAGYAMLDKILPTLISFGRPPGALTEKEWDFLRATGPSKNNTRETNAMLASMIRSAASIQSDYADFAEEITAKGGDLGTVNRLWSKYRDSFSLIQEQDGGIVVNESYPSWHDFRDSGGFLAERSEPNGDGWLGEQRLEAPGQAQQAPQAAQAGGSEAERARAILQRRGVKF